MRNKCWPAILQHNEKDANGSSTSTDSQDKVMSFRKVRTLNLARDDFSCGLDGMMWSVDFTRAVCIHSSTCNTSPGFSGVFGESSIIGFFCHVQDP